MRDRWLHLWEGEVARLDAFTMDGRLLARTRDLQMEMRPASRPLPLPLTIYAERVGWVCSLRLGQYGNAIVAAGILDLNVLDASTRLALLDGREIEAGLDVEALTSERPFAEALHITEWRARAVGTGLTYRSAWANPTKIRLQTGEYADLNRWTS